MKMLDEQLKDMDNHLKVIEKESEDHGKDSENMEHRMEELMKELDRRALERKADEIIKEIDKAIEGENEDTNKDPQEGDRTQRLDDFFSENAKLFGEISRFEAKNETPDIAGSTVINSTSFHNRGNSNNKKKQSFSGFPTMNKFGNFSGVDNQKRPKKILTSAVNSRLTSWSKIEMKKVGNGISSRNQHLEVKNPKKVEALIEKAKKLTEKVY